MKNYLYIEKEELTGIILLEGHFLHVADDLGNSLACLTRVLLELRD